MCTVSNVMRWKFVMWLAPLRYPLIAWVDISPNCPRSAHIILFLAACPLLSIFSVLEDMNNSVWYLLSIVNFQPHPYQMRMNQPFPCPSAHAHIVRLATWTQSARSRRDHTRDRDGRFSAPPLPNQPLPCPRMHIVRRATWTQSAARTAERDNYW